MCFKSNLSIKRSHKKKLTAVELQIEELCDNEKFTAVFLESEVTEPLKYHRHLLCASVDVKSQPHLKLTSQISVFF